MLATVSGWSSHLCDGGASAFCSRRERKHLQIKSVRFACERRSSATAQAFWCDCEHPPTVESRCASYTHLRLRNWTAPFSVSAGWTASLVILQARAPSLPKASSSVQIGTQSLTWHLCLHAERMRGDAPASTRCTLHPLLRAASGFEFAGCVVDPTSGRTRTVLSGPLRCAEEERGHPIGNQPGGPPFAPNSSCPLSPLLRHDRHLLRLGFPVVWSPIGSSMPPKGIKQSRSETMQ